MPVAAMLSFQRYLAIEDALGAIPIVGDMAHIAWKANRRNYNLLVRDPQQHRRHTWHDWVFVICACLILAILFAAPVALLFYLLRSHPHAFGIDSSRFAG